jgi:glutathione peroxidase
MKHLFGVLLMASTIATAAEKGFYGLSAPDNSGKIVPLAQYEGKVALVVNTASKCGYTPQYKDLEALYEKYKEKGFVVLGFPSNDFGKQEPKDNAEIKKFCETNYNIKFPLFSKDSVKGDQKQEVYKYLTAKGPEKTRGEIGWNFTKFLVDKKGNIVDRWDSKIPPSAPEVVSRIETALK